MTAAPDWGAPSERFDVRPAHVESYEYLCHESGIPAFVLNVSDPRRAALRDELLPPRLERAIGVVYRPQMELLSHYFSASLPRQFDDYIWFDETQALAELPVASVAGNAVPETYPFGA